MAYRQTDKVRERLAARHARIIAAAHEIAAQHGMEAVQIVAVAERAGIAAGTVYRYFPAKTALVEALIAAVAETEIDAMRRAASMAPGPLSALAAAIVAFAGRAARQRKLIWALTAEPVEPDIDRARLAFRRGLIGEIEVRLAAAEAGGIAPALAAPAILGALLEGLVGPLAPTPENDSRARENVQTLVLLILRGLGIVDARARGLVVQTPWPAAA